MLYVPDKSNACVNFVYKFNAEEICNQIIHLKKSKRAQSEKMSISVDRKIYCEKHKSCCKKHLHKKIKMDLINW